MSKPIFVMLVGLPGSGKSTLTKQYLDMLPNAVVLSTDDLIESYAKQQGKTYSEVFKEYVDTAQKKFNDHLERATNLQVNIIHDQTNLTKKKRKSILDKIPSQYMKVCIECYCHHDETDVGLGNRPGKIITPDIMVSMKQRYEYPTKDEGFDLVLYYDSSTSSV